MIDSKQDLREYRRALARVLESVTFHKSTRLRQLLSYLCEEDFAGRGTDLREYEIGIHVFGRGKDFEPSEDSIVRASVRQLRAKLLEYYSGEGAEDEWQVEIPRGSYVPTFGKRTLAPPAAEPSPAPVTTEPLTPEMRPQPTSRSGPAVWLLAAAVLAAAFLAGRWTVRSPEPGQAVPVTPPGELSLMAHFLASTEGPIRFVPSDSVINLVRSLTARPITLENYSSKSFFAGDHPAVAANPGHWNSIVSRELMNIGDASIVLRTAREHPDHLERFSFRQARDLQMRDLKEGNFVFLGSAQANPWLRVFEESLNFRIGGAEEESGRWENSTPLPGEQTSYPLPPLRATAVSEVSYAQLALVPNQSGSGKVLMAGGNTMPDTEAAGEFLLKPGSGATIAEALGVATLAESPYFEVLLETRRAGTTRQIARVIAGRRIAGAPVDAKRSPTNNAAK
jgi:hypothetical protein